MVASAAQASVYAVVVTYHPEEGVVALLDTLAAQCAGVVVVDNASDASTVAVLQRWASADSARELVALGANEGIARAQNIGIERALGHGATHILLSDDDSEPPLSMVEDLLTAMGSISPPPGAVGPLVGEMKEGGDQLVYVSRRWGPRRARPDELATQALRVPFVIASGCLIDVRCLKRVGLMDESLFIDHVDLEWGLRAGAHGFALYVIPGVAMEHSLGDATTKLWWRAQPIHIHAPVRTYYLVRNTIALIRRGTFTLPWALGYMLWLCKYTAFNAILADRRGERIRQMTLGATHALRGRSGPR
ncbi:glycosyltransferase family 2 protein [Schaalia sp. Marseille-Q2122]|uniref:glycosyltransferase family 2 protein n=1 Tax=Schaalia sp. Marseille-Q2122 TaxID=2736604 RepID=UPI00158BC6C4|nr:glycosyltransferase family 2 protein [Schaalia sp. Marseille-Q2122]